MFIRGATSDSFSLYVFGEANDKPVHLLVNTGTTRTIIRPDVLFCEKPTKRKVSVKLRTATGQQIPTHGIMRVNLEIGSRVFRHEVIAADITEEVILGMDVILGIDVRYSFNLDLKKDVSRIDNEETPFSETVYDVLKIHLCEDVTLPILSETVVMARHDGDVENVSTYVMDSCVDSSLEKGLAVGKILVEMKKTYR
ncbi:hypothetical protein HHI36_001321 [Cryptolaemus montrouzieri]|uniref:Peptidase A2 domain-containing protein n=1 Tax=Cryptolaemus montrouzieri TaxID=559131 RepID=A0ABD2P796_9CUCU